MRPTRLLLLLAAFMCGHSAAKTQSDWPDADSIVEVSVLVFQHANAPTPIRTQNSITSFPSAIRLPKASELESQEPIWHRRDPLTTSMDSRTLPWSMQNWLRFLHIGLLSQLDQPLTGPPLPPRPASPLLNSPLLMRESLERPASLRQTESRLDASPDHRLLVTMHWYQLLEHQRTALQILIADEPSQMHIPWLAASAWIEPSSNRAIYADRLTGYVQLRKDQFMRAQLEICWHQTQQRTMGPLKPSHLAPTGYLVACLEVNRAIEPDQWNYFDSETLGVLLRINTR